MSDQPEIDIEAEQAAWELWTEQAGLTTPRDHEYEMMRFAWLARARIAAERERSLLDQLADAQHAVCCCSCPELEEGEPDRHCETCVRIGEALTRKGPSNER